MKKVWSYPNLPMAHLLRSMLEEAGIRAQLVGNEVGWSEMTLLQDTSWWPAILVEDAQVAAALAIVRAFDLRQRNEAQEPQPRAPSWRCPSCGTDVEPQFAVCWQCCADRP